MSGNGQGAFSFAEAKRQWAEAWSDARHTRYELPPVDVNRVLAARYTPAARMSRAQLWDMEVRKAWDPATYIPYVVSRGRSWGRHALEAHCERFFRASDQTAWIDGGRGQVLEDVSISHAERRIFFLGRAQLVDERGETLQASGFQPLFHVEHAAEGSPGDPVNVWRIVVMTQEADARYEEPFRTMAASGLLPGFIEEYVRRDMGVPLARR